MTLIFKANTPEQALAAITDWLVERAKAREAQGRSRPGGNSYTLLDNAAVGALVMASKDLAEAAIVPSPNEPAPPPTRKLFNVVGCVHFSNGFDLTVEADDEDAAKEAAESMVNVGSYHLEAELQEVDIQMCRLVEEVTITEG